VTSEVYKSKAVTLDDWLKVQTKEALDAAQEIENILASLPYVDNKEKKRKVPFPKLIVPRQTSMEELMDILEFRIEFSK
jgi:hypothetical protein